MTTTPTPGADATTGNRHPTGTARLVLRLGRAFLEIGMPAHRIEAAMHVVARKLGLHGDFFSTPTALIAALGDGNRHRTLMVRAQPGQVNLSRLSDLSEIIEGLDADRLTVGQAADRVEALLATPASRPGWLEALAFGLYSASVACFFRGNWLEIACAGGIGILVGLFGALTASRESASRVFAPLGAALAAFTATLLGSQLPGISPFLITLAGIIVLVPGLAFTVSIRELATGQLVSGSSRLSGALVTFLVLTFGVALGTYLGQAAVEPLDAARMAAAPQWTKYVAMVTAAVAFVGLFRARPRDLGWILLAGVLAVEGGEAGRALLGQQLGPFVGGFAVGLGGNLLSRLRGRPAATIQFPGLILLVPGSIGLSGLTAMAQADVMSGVQTAFTATMIGVALITGMLLSSLLVPPKREY